jgi:alpha-L-arabinofuranosidase
MKISLPLMLLATTGYLLLAACKNQKPAGEPDAILTIYPDSILNDVSRHPIGINLDYFMDGDRYPNGQRVTTDALKKMGIKYLRYPGGDKSDLNLFSVPPYERSVPTLARTGKGAVDDYVYILKDYKNFKYDVLDFDEFMTMCSELHAEPVIVVPADSYLKKYPPGCTWTDRESLIKNAVEWVRYANIKKRYRIKYWMVGNECWNPNNVNSTAEIYAQDVLDFSKAMKAVDPSITIAANGNNADYFKPVIQKAGDAIDYLTLSNYPVWDYHRGYFTYRDTLQNLTEPIDRAMKAIDLYATEEQKKKLKIIIAEYGPFDWANKWPHINDMGHNLANFEMTGEQLLRPEVEFSCFWNTRWIENDTSKNSVFDALDKNGNFNANGYGLMIWGKYLGDKMLKTTSTVYLRSFASVIPAEKKLYVYVVNKNEKPQSIQIDVESSKIKSLIQARELFGKNPDDCEPVWQKREMSNSSNLEVKGTSITVIEYQLK